MNHFYAWTTPLAEVTWDTDTPSFDYTTVDGNLAAFFHWFGSHSGAGWLLLAAGIGLALFYYWCLGPFPNCFDTEYDDYDYFE